MAGYLGYRRNNVFLCKIKNVQNYFKNFEKRNYLCCIRVFRKPVLNFFKWIIYYTVIYGQFRQDPLSHFYPLNPTLHRYILEHYLRDLKL